MIAVVLDTNVVVSALLQPTGPPAQIFVLMLGGIIKPCISGLIYAEYEDVLRRPRLRLSEETIEAALRALREKCRWVKPQKTARACSDPDDDIFLDCAEEARADYLVTGNLRHFPESWVDTRVVSPRAFLEVLEAERRR